MWVSPGFFTNCRRETVEKSVPPGNRRGLDSVLDQYVAGSDARGRPEERSYPWSQQAIREISGLTLFWSTQEHSGY